MGGRVSGTAAGGGDALGRTGRWAGEGGCRWGGARPRGRAPLPPRGTTGRHRRTTFPRAARPRGCAARGSARGQARHRPRAARPEPRGGSEAAGAPNARPWGSRRPPQPSAFRGVWLLSLPVPPNRPGRRRRGRGALAGIWPAGAGRRAGTRSRRLGARSQVRAAAGRGPRPGGSGLGPALPGRARRGRAGRAPRRLPRRPQVGRRWVNFRTGGRGLGGARERVELRGDRRRAGRGAGGVARLREGGRALRSRRSWGAASRFLGRRRAGGSAHPSRGRSRGRCLGSDPLSFVWSVPGSASQLRRRRPGSGAPLRAAARGSPRKLRGSGRGRGGGRAGRGLLVL